MSAVAMVLVLVVAQAAATGPAVGASAPVVVSADVTTAVTITNGCRAAVAWELGLLSADVPALTDRDASVCRIGFGSSNSASRLRVRQADAVGQAMAQPQLSWSTVLSNGVSFNDEYQLARGSGTVGYAARRGSYDTFNRTDDGGDNWTSMTDAGSPAIAHRAIAASPDGNVVWRFGNSSARVSIDKGVTWNPTPTVHSSITNVLAAAAFDANHVAVTGNSHYVVYTADGGTSWNSMYCGGVQGVARPRAEQIFATSANNNQICLTTDATAASPTWVTRAAADGLPDVRWYGVDAVAGATAADTVVWVAGGSGAVARSIDAGTTWTDVSIPGAPIALQAISASSASSAVATGYDGHVWATTDSGASWTRVYAPTLSVMTSVVATGASRIWVAGAANTFLTSADAGGSWTRVVGTKQALHGVAARGRDLVYAVGGAGAVKRSTDGGTSWSAMDVPGAPNLTGVAVAAVDNVVVVGQRGVIHSSADAGVSWTARSSGTTADFNDVASHGANLLVAVGDGGVIATSRGGHNWVVRSSGTTEHLKHATVLDDDRALAVGRGGVVRHTTDGGVSWLGTTIGAGTDTITSVTRDTLGDAYLVAGGSVYRSSDGGASWVLRGTSPVDHISAGGAGVLIGVRSWDSWTTAMYRSADGGATWSSYSTSTNPFGRGIVAVDANVAFYVSENDTIRRTDIGSEVPDYAASAWSGTGSLFGGCLQALGGGAAASAWLEDAAGTINRCEAVDTDPWNAVPTSAATIATLGAAGSGHADLVWGMRASSTQAPATYSAGIIFEVLAP